MRAMIVPWVRCRAAALLTALMPNDQIGLDELAVRGRVEPTARAVSGTIGTAVKLPLGSIRVTGHAEVQYRCDGTFDGTMTYAWPLRIAARIKGVHLVTQLGGEIHVTSARQCQLAPSTFAGQFVIQDTVLAGYLKTSSDSIALRGDVRPLSRASWHAHLTNAENGELAIRIHFIANAKEDQ